MEERKLTKADIDKVRHIEGFPVAKDEDIIAKIYDNRENAVKISINQGAKKYQIECYLFPQKAPKKLLYSKFSKK